MSDAAVQTALDRAIERAGGSEAKLGEAIGYSQVAINKAKKAGRCTTGIAAAIHHWSGGEIRADELCPNFRWPDFSRETAEASR